MTTNKIDTSKLSASVKVRAPDREYNRKWRLLYIVHLNDLGNHFPRIRGEEVTHTFYLILFWQGEVDYQNNSSYIFKEEEKHSLGATALSALYTRCLLFNGSSYLGNENEIRSRPHFPIEKNVHITWGKWEYYHSLSSLA